ncbi:MAG TPA: ABC transporter permease [Nitrososphaerales archaeon]|nr:ABC transporter permease [Nitrososphaerales archaeon]
MRASRVLTFARYEMRRAVARKKVLALVALTVLIAIAPYYLLTVFHSTSSLITPPLRPYLWIIGVFLPQAFFVQFTALLIAAGSMSEEYESGTAEVLLSKPVSRAEYFFGKYLGGYALLVGILTLDVILSLTSATASFGPQEELGILPMIFVAQVFAASVFYSVAFMVGELMRRSSLSYILSASVFFTSGIIGVVLDVLYELTGSGMYKTVNLFLPTTPVDSLPLLLAEPRFPSAVLPLFRAGLATPVETSVLGSVLLIAVYSGAAIVVALAYFSRMDVAKRVT